MESPVSDQENVLNDTLGRKCAYRKLLTEVEDIEESDDIGLETIKTLNRVIKKVNKIELDCNIDKRFQFPEETILDATVLRSASTVLVKCADAVDVNSSTYEVSEFQNKIIDFCKDGDEYEPENLLKLLNDVHTIIPKTPEYRFLYGAYDLYKLPLPKQKKERVKSQKENLQKKKPEKVARVEKEDDSIEEIVRLLYSVLVECYDRHNEEPINYYDYIIDTDSYSKTIENMFYCSFLIRDGKAHIDIDGRGVPYIKPMRKSALKRYREEGGANAQMIAAITYSDWETYKKDGYIQKHRKKSSK